MATNTAVTRFAAGLCTLLSAACVEQNPISPTASTLVVHAVLDASTRDQYVVVQHTSGLVMAQTPVTGAHVTITTPDGLVMQAREVRDSTVYRTLSYMVPVKVVYRISLDEYGVSLQQGGTYGLRVSAGGLGEVTGSTTMPITARGSQSPMDSLGVRTLIRERDTLRLTWRRVAQAPAYELSIATPRGARFTTFADTSIALAGTLLEGNVGAVFWVGMRQSITISAVDANYYDYFRRGSDELTALGPIMHLRGGVGVFGAIAPVASLVVDVR